MTNAEDVKLLGFLPALYISKYVIGQRCRSQVQGRHPFPLLPLQPWNWSCAIQNEYPLRNLHMVWNTFWSDRSYFLTLLRLSVIVMCLTTLSVHQVGYLKFSILQNRQSIL